MRSLRVVAALVVAASLALASSVPAAAARGGRDSITPSDLKEWLSYIASDELEGRQVYSEGLGLAAAYIEDHLAAWHVKPGGDDGTYFQTVKVLGIKTQSHSRVTVTINGQSRTFDDGNGVTFPRNQGGKRTVTGPLQFVGYGIAVPSLHHDDFADRRVAGAVVLYIGRGPSGMTPADNRLVPMRGRSAIELQHAVAAIGPAVPGRRASGTPVPIDFQTTQRLDSPVAPRITAGDDFYRFVLGAAGANYDELKEKADRGEALPELALPNASVTIDVNADYDVVQTRLTRNVVGIVEGRDPALKDTYVLFGAHYDHLGYRPAPVPANAPPVRNAGGCDGQAQPTPRPGDIINNGADDDGSGTVAVLALARAYALGPAPKRSVMFVWHAGEEAGLLGSRYMADHPEVPLDRVAAQLNIDMVGRNHCDDPNESDTVYVVGADRISTELHNLNEDANRSLDRPLTLNYDLNDPADPESYYTRSDHYSYAAKGIPIIFFTTGLHRDYHFVTDEVGRIEFPKLARVTQLVYATSWRVANLDHFPVRDNKGPRMGRGQSGKIKETR